VAIFVIRHGETPGNAARILQHPDTPLSPRGVEQAERLARRLAGQPVGRILASDFTRAAMTAAALETATGAPLLHDRVLQERNFGDLRGTPYADLDFDPFAPGYEPPGGESWEVFHGRVGRAWEVIRAVAADTPGHLAVVTHGLVCFSLAAHHFRLPADEPAPARFGNTALTVVDGREPWVVRRLNCTAHLDGSGADDDLSGRL
jgi:broad specificity phosphatase PhoE